MSRPPRTSPDPGFRRPPEPKRPEPAVRAGLGLLAVRVRRRRFRRILPPEPPLG